MEVICSNLKKTSIHFEGIKDPFYNLFQDMYPSINPDILIKLTLRGLQDKVVNSLYTVESYKKSVEENLNAKSETLISNIRELHKYTISSDVELLDFVAFINDLDVSITMFSMDRQANEVFNKGKDSVNFAGSLDMIENVAYIHLMGNQTEDFWTFYENNEEELSTVEKDAIAKWVTDCWEKADGQAISLPAYFSLHDEYETFDLKKKKWISDDEKWSY